MENGGKNGDFRDGRRLVAEVLAESEPSARRLGFGVGRTFASLAHRDFLLFWTGAWLSNIGTWLQIIALGWLVVEMTNSSIHLGLLSFASSIPVFFLSFAAGIWADRTDKKMLILWMQVALMVLAALLGVLVTLRIQTIWSIIVLAFLSGVASTFSFPAWQAYISEIVPRENLLNAIALNAAQFHAARLLGPTLAGFIVAFSGAAACFYLNAASFLAVIAALLLMKRTPRRRRDGRSPLEEFKEGLGYILGNRLILYLLLGVGIMSVFGLNFYSVLMPKFAKDVFAGDARTFGLLMGANGGGALAGALAVANISNRVRRSSLIKYGMLAFSVSIIVFAFSRSLPLAMAALAAAGFSFLTVNSTLNTTLQSIVPQAMRGRVMSFFVWMFMGWMPLGSLMAGLMAHRLGPPLTVALSAVVPLVLSLYLILRFPAMKIPEGAR